MHCIRITQERWLEFRFVGKKINVSGYTPGIEGMRLYKHFWIGGMEDGGTDMWELEKILAEIYAKSRKMQTIKLPIKFYRAVGTREMEKILRRHMSWISVEEMSKILIFPEITEREKFEKPNKE